MHSNLEPSARKQKQHQAEGYDTGEAKTEVDKRSDNKMASMVCCDTKHEVTYALYSLTLATISLKTSMSNTQRHLLKVAEGSQSPQVRAA